MKRHPSTLGNIIESVTAAQKDLLGQLVGQVEIAAEFRVSRALVNKWIKANSDFPEPAVTLAAGRLPLRPEVQVWHAAYRARLATKKAL